MKFFSTGEFHEVVWSLRNHQGQLLFTGTGHSIRTELGLKVVFIYIFVCGEGGGNKTTVFRSDQPVSTTAIPGTVGKEQTAVNPPKRCNNLTKIDVQRKRDCRRCKGGRKIARGTGRRKRGGEKRAGGRGKSEEGRREREREISDRTISVGQRL